MVFKEHGVGILNKELLFIVSSVSFLRMSYVLCAPLQEKDNPSLS